MDKRISHGLPKLSSSPACVPLPADHFLCRRVECDLFYQLVVPQKVVNFSNRIWGSVPLGLEYLPYTTEADICSMVKMFPEDLIHAMGLNFKLVDDFGINYLRPDIAVLTMGNRMVGVVKIKKPGDIILTEETVLGELLDQMLLVEGFYKSGPVCGLLITGEQYMMCWLPEDNDCFVEKFEFQIESLDLTPTKHSASASSPPRTPSQKSVEWGRELGDVASDEVEVDNGSLPAVERTLITTPILSIYDNLEATLQLLYTALARMSKVGMYFKPGKSDCLFVFHKEEQSISWHKISYEEAISRVCKDSNRMPRSDAKRLLALEDLGRGAAGRAWLVCTLSETNAGVCVLKFSNNTDYGRALKQELEVWKLVYPEFGTTRVEEWSGSHALVMRYFATLQTAESRRRILDGIREVLEQKF